MPSMRWLTVPEKRSSRCLAGAKRRLGSADSGVEGRNRLGSFP